MIPVEVTVRIGRDGRVLSARTSAQSDGVRGFLAQQALAAAKKWRFRPARLGSETIASERTLHFRFYRTGVEWN